MKNNPIFLIMYPTPALVKIICY